MTAATPRDEIRSITTTDRVTHLNFPGVYQAWQITREVFDLHSNPLHKRTETVYGITSLTTWQANPADVVAFNRGHWSIENREHHVRDVTFDEDRSQVSERLLPAHHGHHEKHRDQPPPPRRLDQHQTSHRENKPPPRPSPHTPRRLTKRARKEVITTTRL